MTCAIGAFAQNNSLVNSNIKALENYAMANPIEKVHLHLDRQLYFPADTIWFKAYVVIGDQHKLSALSGILYAELIGPKDTVLKRLTLGITAGTASGDFELPYNVAPGGYRIRAYTNWMRNAGPEYFYEQTVTVSGFSTNVAPGGTNAVLNQDNTSQRAANNADKIDLQFFPEGGDLINGLRSKVAFKAVNQNGMAEEVQGSIIDNSGSEVATFASQHLGMGVFPLGPQKGMQYFAKVTAADGSKFTMPLPAAKDAGFTLSVNNNLGDSLYIKIAAANVPDTAFYLVAQSGGKYYFAAARRLADKVFTASIGKDRFPGGVLQLTLFSQTGEPLNERVVFIQNSDQLSLSLSMAKQTYAPGEKVKFGLDAKDKDGSAATGTFSVSVIDENKVPVNENTESNIFADLMLKSELAGSIEDPNYYFINPTDQTKADLDLLMLTQGYHRFEWKKILAKPAPAPAYQPEKGFRVSGTVTTPGGKPVANGKVILTSIKHLMALDTLTDAAGRFAFDDLNFPDTAKLIINAKKANGGNNVVLKIDRPDYPVVSSAENEKGGYARNHFSITASQAQQAYTTWRQDSLSHVIQLMEVKVKDHKTTSFRPDYAVLLKHSSNLNGPGQADQVVMGDELTGCANLADCLVVLLRGGVRFVYSGPSPTIYSTHIPRALSGATKPMAVLVNGVITDQEALATIPATDVQSIEMLESPMYSGVYGSAASGGLIVITTKYGDEANYVSPLQPGLTLYTFRGFYKAKTFYSPKYTPDKKVSLADNRKTIYWQSNLFTNKDGKASFDYFNAGNPGKYRVVVEGVDGNGKLARQVLQYDVVPAN
ncbi:MAG TPA: hypothetical protein VFE53_11530 [Mucilaginibacter sp.]|nr:hypothetical protein [Mucilaginibacter sp.]